MGFLPTLLSACLLLLPGPGSETSKPVGLESLAFAWAGSFHHPCDRLLPPSDRSSPGRLFFESLDESALEEEETSEVEDSALLSQVLFGEDGYSTPVLNSTPPRQFHGRTLAAPSILRC